MRHLKLIIRTETEETCKYNNRNGILTILKILLMYVHTTHLTNVFVKRFY